MVAINWSKDDSPEDDLCGKYEDCFVDIINSNKNLWKVLFASRDTGRTFAFREAAKFWIEQEKLSDIILYLR